MEEKINPFIVKRNQIKITCPKKIQTVEGKVNSFIVERKQIKITHPKNQNENLKP